MGSTLTKPSSKFWNALLLYGFFFYFSGITHLLLQITDATIFVSLRQAFYMSFLWLIPVLLWPNKTKLIAGGIGIILWLTSMISLGYFCIYQQEFSHSVLFIALDSNIAESTEYLLQYFRWWMLPIFLGHTLIAIWFWRNLKPVTLSPMTKLSVNLLILTALFIFPMAKTILINHETWDYAVNKIQKRMEPAEPWQLIIGYFQYREQLANMDALLETNRQLPPLKNLTDKNQSLPATLVMVIGESTNRQHMQLYGYNRKTTPRLDAIKDELMIFKNVVSSQPSTIESLQEVLTFADPENPDLYLKQPSLMNMMKQAGYKTYWITNQQTLTNRNTMLTNFSKQMDVQYYLNNTRHQNSTVYDEAVLKPFEEVLSDDAPRKFIVVHLLGTHMKYEYRFPKEFKQFTDAEGIPSSIQDTYKINTINDYDNAVLYNDYIVTSLIEKLADTQDRSLLTYFSDHGEDVFDTPPHNFVGRNIDNPTMAMYSVPMLIWHCPEWQELNISDNNIDKPYNLADFIHTWSDLAGLEYKGFNQAKSLVNEKVEKFTLYQDQMKLKLVFQ